MKANTEWFNFLINPLLRISSLEVRKGDEGNFLKINSNLNPKFIIK